MVDQFEKEDLSMPQSHDLELTNLEFGSDYEIAEDAEEKQITAKDIETAYLEDEIVDPEFVYKQTTATETNGDEETLILGAISQTNSEEPHEEIEARDQEALILDHLVHKIAKENQIIVTSHAVAILENYLNSDSFVLAVLFVRLKHETLAENRMEMQMKHREPPFLSSKFTRAIGIPGYTDFVDFCLLFPGFGRLIDDGVVLIWDPGGQNCWLLILGWLFMKVKAQFNQPISAVKVFDKMILILSGLVVC